MKTLVNEVWTEIAYHDDGHLLHTDKRTGKQTITSADRMLAEGLGKIQWEEIEEF